MLSANEKIPDEVLQLGKNSDNLRLLCEQLNTPQQVIPFVGAGLSIPFGFKGWSEFLRDEAQKVGIGAKVSKHLNAHDYERAAEALQESMGFRAFYDAINASFGDNILKGKRFDDTAVSVVPRLTAGPVITTNFDHVLERVFHAAGTSFEYVVWGAKEDITAEILTQNSRILLKLHGDFKDRTDRVLTRADYRKHYGKNKLLLRLLNNIMSSRPLLFLGCSLARDRTMDVLRRTVRTDQAIAHFAIIEYPSTQKNYYKRARFLSGLGIRPIWFPSGRFDLIQPMLEYLATNSLRNRTLHNSVTRPVSQLATEASGWLAIAGYQIVDQKPQSPEIIDVIAQSLSHPSLGHILVRCQEGEANRPKIASLHKALLDRQIERGWLLVDSRIARHLKRKATRIEIFTRENLIHAFLNLDPYFAWLSSLATSQQVSKYYVSLGCEKPIYDSDGYPLFDDNGCKVTNDNYDSIDKYVDSWKNDRGNSQLAILGDFGTGKTWFCIWYAHRQLKKHLADPLHERIPFLVPLHRYSRVTGIRELITDLLCNIYHIHMDSAHIWDAFSELNRKGRLLLLLDGFDEMTLQVDRHVQIRNLQALDELSISDSKILLTCRTSYFRTLLEEIKLLSGHNVEEPERIYRSNYEVVHLSEFTSAKIKQVLLLPSVLSCST